jgi:tRNA (guanine-N7-)-methyltransferase
VAVATVVENVIVDLGRVSLPLHPVELFGDERPIELELGVGNGQFLLDWAAGHPGLGFLGVERSFKYCTLAAGRAARRDLSNVRLLRTTAEDALNRCLAAASVSAVHVYFPDPWPKKRHHKRRLVSPGNLAAIGRVLAPGGLLRIKTDHASYAALIGALLDGEEALVDVGDEGLFATLPVTNYETKAARAGRPIHAFAFRRS